ncbi:MAG TPA: hypothetical protein VHP63_06540, partial [candidate division Zixibacteria bacterium]|nr:hypothetical protein [candidate division Zixibacteria bacterium]
LNLFLQRDLATDWTSFVNFEIINSYSSFRDWGSFNLEEAWVGYRSSDQFKFKVGLQIPEFNNLNIIKNRSPLLPYIFRPIIYETSFGESVNLDVLTPNRAYAQIYGSIPSRGLKIDYAGYLGNSSNVRTSEQVRATAGGNALQSGVDTTNGFMVGTRLGVRYKGVKAGFSTTHEKSNTFVGVENFLNQPASNYTYIPLVRLGGDLSFSWKDFAVESEYANARFTRDIAPGLKVEAEFFYVTLGYYFNEYLFVYGSLSQLRIEEFGLDASIDSVGDTVYSGFAMETDVDLPTAGFSYTFSDRLTFKGQVLLADLDEKRALPNNPNPYSRTSRGIDRYALAVSVFF